MVARNRTATTEQVAATLHVKPATVRKYAREGRVPFDTTPGGHRRFNIDEAVAALLGEAPGDDPKLAGPDDDPRWMPVGEVPYVHVAPSFGVTVRSTVRTSLEVAEIPVLDAPDDAVGRGASGCLTGGS